MVGGIRKEQHSLKQWSGVLQYIYIHQTDSTLPYHLAIAGKIHVHILATLI
jgi:hypothetical protein